MRRILVFVPNSLCRNWPQLFIEFTTHHIDTIRPDSGQQRRGHTSCEILSKQTFLRRLRWWSGHRVWCVSNFALATSFHMIQHPFSQQQSSFQFRSVRIWNLMHTCKIVGKFSPNYFRPCKCHRIERRMWNLKSNWLCPSIGIVWFDLISFIDSGASNGHNSVSISHKYFVSRTKDHRRRLERTASKCIFILRFDKIISVPSAHSNYTHRILNWMQSTKRKFEAQTQPAARQPSTTSTVFRIFLLGARAAAAAAHSHTQTRCAKWRDASENER